MMSKKFAFLTMFCTLALILSACAVLFSNGAPLEMPQQAIPQANVTTVMQTQGSQVTNDALRAGSDGGAQQVMSDGVVVAPSVAQVLSNTGGGNGAGGSVGMTLEEAEADFDDVVDVEVNLMPVSTSVPTMTAASTQVAMASNSQPTPIPATPIPATPIPFVNADVNPFVDAADDNLSTFAMDVDTASYTLARNYLQNGAMPPPQAIRPEEFINYFPTNYAAPTSPDDAFAIQLDAAPSPFGDAGQLLLRVGLQGRVIAAQDRDPAFLVFVVDTSGSMSGSERLGMVRDALTLLTNELRADDRVALVEYENQARVILPPTSAAEKETINAAISQLVSKGSTYAEAGLRLGYQIAQDNMRPGENTRVVLLSDGVANVGQTGPDAILQTIRDQVAQGVTLSTIGVGMGTYNDVLMEQLANDGNGNYHYVDDIREARRVFVNNLTSTLQVIAYDAKIQIAFNPDVVAQYRLIGYENRAVADSDFRNDTVDAGEVGAGHTVTALYEIELQPQAQGELATAFVRYEDADTREIVEVNQRISLDDVISSFDDAAPDFRTLAAVAELSELLRHSIHAQQGDYAAVVDLLQRTPGSDPYVMELLAMAQRATQINS